MTEPDDGTRPAAPARRPDAGAPTSPRARTSSGPAGVPGTSTGTSTGTSAGTSTGTGAAVTRTGGDRRPWWRRGWDIPWLGGRSSAPWVVLATVVVLLLALAGTLYAKQKPDRLGFNTVTSEALNDTTVRFTFEVFKAPEAEAACEIVAADREGGVGALRDVPVPPRTDGEENNVVTVLVPTTRRADTAVLQGCRIVRTG